MQELSERYKKAKNLVNRLGESLTLFIEEEENERLYNHLRDSCIKRFEFAMEPFWKFLRSYGQEKFGVDFETASPKKVFVQCGRVGLITLQELELVIKIAEDVKLSSSIYEEEFAEELLERLEGHHKVMQCILDRCEV